MAGEWQEYLKDPFLDRLYTTVKAAGTLRSIVLDLTHVCNIRCQGCYFFAENMDNSKAPEDEESFDAFVAKELERRTNFVTAVGGEPSLMLSRLKKLYDHFYLSTATNGLKKIPHTGFENLGIGVSVWGDHRTDTILRGSGTTDVFEKGLQNYRDDRRAIWYYTTTPGNAHEIESVVEQCVANGNFVTFNYYGDLLDLGGTCAGKFDRVRREVDRMIDRFPGRILTSTYINEVTTTNMMLGQRWGYDVCCTISPDNPVNQERIRNGHPFNPHFRAYNSDLKTTRRCCVGIDSDCGKCYNVYARFSWIMMNLEGHLGSKKDFTNWLTSLYLFYLGNRIVDFEEGVALLPELHDRLRLQRVSSSTISLTKTAS
jgi:MoaA/NifB/PqqE/SkfB family radical SAM enzyme